MRTTLDLPEHLVRDAMKVSHHNTKTATIVEALRDFVRRARIQELRGFKGQVDLDIDLKTLRKRG